MKGLLVLLQPFLQKKGFSGGCKAVSGPAITAQLKAKSQGGNKREMFPLLDMKRSEEDFLRDATQVRVRMGTA